MGFEAFHAAWQALQQLSAAFDAIVAPAGADADD